MALPALIKVGVSVPFPAQVQGAGGILVTKSNGVYTITPNFGALGVIGAVADPTTEQVWVFNPVTGVYNVMTLANVGASIYKPITPPQGRLTLTSGTAVPTTDVAAANTLFYTPAAGRFVPLWNGTSLVMVDTGGELSQLTTDATKSPAAVAVNSNYDIFVWIDGNTMRATRGPAWTSDTARGTGAGTSELDFATAPGVPLNKNAITNGPAAGRGTYVGTVRSNGTSTFDLTFGTAAAGGGPALLNVWNAYNQAIMRGYVRDSTATWTYSTSAVRALNNSNGNRVSFVSGLAQHAIYSSMSVHVVFAAAAGAAYAPGLALDSTTVQSFLAQFTNSAAVANIKMLPLAVGIFPPQFGFHFIQEVEFGDGTNTNTLDQVAANGAGLQVMAMM